MRVSKINGIPVFDTVVSAFTYNNINTFTIENTDGTSFNAEMLVISASTVSATTFYGDGSNLTGIGGGGSVDGALNVGDGSGIFRDLTGSTLNFRSITGATNEKILTSITGDTIEIDVNEPNLTLWPLVVQGNTLISGSATYLSGLTFDVSALEYIIGTTIYNAAASQVTLTSGDTSFDRIDVIYADISGNTGVVDGVASASPSKPSLDSATQVEVTFVTVPAGGSAPDVTVTKVYDEDTGTGGGEWDFSANTAVRISGDSTADSFSGSKSIEFVAATKDDEFTMDNPTPYDTSLDNTITFYIKNKVQWHNRRFIEMSFLDSGGTINGNVVIFDNNKYGFSHSNTSSWQSISIGLGDFGLTSNLVSKLRFEVKQTGNQSTTRPALELFIDLIRFQEGAPTTSPQSIWLSFIADDGNTAIATSNTDQLRLSGGTNIGTEINSATKVATFNLDDDILLNSATASTQMISPIFSGDGVTDAVFRGTGPDIHDIRVQKHFYHNTAGTINVGQPVFLKGWSGGSDVVTVELADATAGDGRMPAIGIVTQSGDSQTQGLLISLGYARGLDTSSYALNESIYVSETLGELTNVKPTGDTKIQRLGQVLKVDASDGIIEVVGAGRSNDTPQLESDHFWLGNVNWLASPTTVDDLTSKGTPVAADKIFGWDSVGGNHVAINWSAVSITSGANLSGGEGVFAQKTGSNLEFKSFTSTGATVTISSDANTINIENASGGGESNTASNVGGGEGLFSGKSGIDLQFKTLTSTGGTLTFDSTGATVNIEAIAGGGETNTADNVGSGTGVFRDKTGTTINLKTITSTGATVTITNDNDTVNIESSGGGGNTVNDATKIFSWYMNIT